MPIKASKCHSFSIYKKSSTSTQYLFCLSGSMIASPTCCHFDFKMADKDKSVLIETVIEQIEIIDKLPLHPKNKLKLCQKWA